MLAKVKEIALGAGEILVEKLESGFTIEHKGSIDLVTDADKAAEEYIVAQIKKHFPSHSIRAEEGSNVEESDEFIWFIDPIDGTTNFAHGFPYFATSLGLIKGNEAVLGVVYNPMTKEMFAAEKGRGAFLNDKRIKVSHEKKLQRSLLATGFAYDVATARRDNLKEYEETVKTTQGVRVLGAAALDLCQVAAGRIEAFWELDLQPWDIAAGSVIVTEAGGKVASCSDGQFNPQGHEVLATNGLIHDELLEILLRNG